MRAIIMQARVSSTRFPNKIFSDIGGEPAIFHILDECLMSKADKVILAIPADQKTHFQTVWSAYKDVDNFKIHAGSEDNVLERYYESANLFDIDTVIRLTSDCFLLRKEHINKSIDFFEKNKYDYINNSTVTRALSEDVPDDYKTDVETPDGFNVEVFKKNCLNEAYECATSKYDIEHVTPWIKRNKHCCVFDTGKISLKGKFSVDTKEDLEVIKALYVLMKNDRIKFESLL